VYTVHAQPSHTVRHVVLISIDGFRPEMYRDPSWPTPNLQLLLKKASMPIIAKVCFRLYLSRSYGMVRPLPARSGIVYNQPIGSKENGMV